MMAKLTFANSVAITATIHLLEFARDIGIDWRKVDAIESGLERLRYVSEVNSAHQFWLMLDLETSRPDIAAKRIALTLEKVERLLRRYTKESK